MQGGREAALSGLVVWKTAGVENARVLCCVGDVLCSGGKAGEEIPASSEASKVSQMGISYIMLVAVGVCSKHRGGE